MTAPVTDPADWRRSVAATGLLRAFNEAGVLEASDVLVAQRLTALAEETDERVALAVAFVVRAVRGGSVCIDLAQIRTSTRGNQSQLNPRGRVDLALVDLLDQLERPLRPTHATLAVGQHRHVLV